MSLRAVMLGTMAGLPAPVAGGRGTYAVLVAAGKDLLLFDCGRGATVNTGRAGYSATDIHRVFFTHLHVDHNIDFADLVLSSWAGGRRGALYVWGVEHTASFVDRLFGRDGAYADDIRARIRAAGGRLSWPDVCVTELFEPQEVTGTVDWTVTAAFVRHCQHHIAAAAYRIDWRNRSIVISGDTTPVREMVELARGADVLIHEGSYLRADLERSGGLSRAHTSAEAVAEIAAEAEVSHLIVNHITPRTTPDKLEHARRLIEQRFAGRVDLAADLMTVELEENQSGTGVIR